MLSRNHMRPVLVLFLALLWLRPCPCEAQEKDKPEDKLLSFISGLTLGAIVEHVDTITCDDALRLPREQVPQVLWTKSSPSAYDGVFIDVFGPPSPNYANRLMYFHWNIANEMMMLVLSENIVMDSVQLVWRSAQEGWHTVIIIRSNYDPIAWVDFYSVYDTASGMEQHGITHFLRTSSGISESFTMSSVLVGVSIPCLVEDSSALEALLADVLAAWEGLKPPDFTPREVRNHILRRFLALKR